jgi:hypothetical protein
MTLLRELQLLLERTYGETGVNFEDFLLDSQRSRLLAEQAGSSASQISDLGRLYMRVLDGKLRLGIHYQPTVIAALEREDPGHGLTDTNIFPFMVLLEELDHALHASLKFKRGDRDIHNEEFVRDLELQAKVDTYLVLKMYCAHFNKSKRTSPADRRWLQACVFDSECFAYQEPLLRERYRQTNRLGRRYVRYLDTLPASKRTAEIRRFQKLPYPGKQARIQSLCA